MVSCSGRRGGREFIGLVTARFSFVMARGLGFVSPRREMPWFSVLIADGGAGESLY